MLEYPLLLKDHCPENTHGILHMLEYPLLLKDHCPENTHGILEYPLLPALVKDHCPENTPIPSLDLVHLQFCLKSPAAVHGGPDHQVTYQF